MWQRPPLLQFVPPRAAKNQVGQEAEGAGDHLVGEQGAEGGGVLHDQRCDWQEGQEEHVHLRGGSMNWQFLQKIPIHHIETLPSLRDRIDSAKAIGLVALQ